MSCLSSFGVCACSLFVCVCVCVQSTTSCVVARDNGTWLGFHIRLLNLRMLCSKTQRNRNTNTSDLLMRSFMWRINLGMNHTRTSQGDTERNKLQLGMKSGTNIVLSALTLHEQAFTLKKFLLSLKENCYRVLCLQDQKMQHRKFIAGTSWETVCIPYSHHIISPWTSKDFSITHTFSSTCATLITYLAEV